MLFPANANKGHMYSVLSAWTDSNGVRHVLGTNRCSVRYRMGQMAIVEEVTAISNAEIAALFASSRDSRTSCL